MTLENFKNQFSNLNWEYADSLFIYAQNNNLIKEEIELILPRVVYSAHSLIIVTKSNVVVVGQGKWFEKNKWSLTLKKEMMFYFLEKKNDEVILNISLLHKNEQDMETVVNIAASINSDYVNKLSNIINIEDISKLDKNQQQEITLYKLKARYQIIDQQIYLICNKSGSTWINKISKANILKVNFNKDSNQLEILLNNNINTLLIKGTESNINNMYKEIKQWTH